MRVEVSVTQEHIDSGTPCSECCCPIALALREALDCDVWVGHHQWGTVGSEKWPMLVLPIPHKAQKFIGLFDVSKARADDVSADLQPFTFTVEVPEG